MLLVSKIWQSKINGSGPLHFVILLYYFYTWIIINQTVSGSTLFDFKTALEIIVSNLSPRIH